MTIPGLPPRLVEYGRFAGVKGQNDATLYVGEGLVASIAVSRMPDGRINYHNQVRRQLNTDAQFRRYFEQETTALPQFYSELARKELGPLWEWLPEGALHHDPYAYLKSATT